MPILYSVNVRFSFCEAGESMLLHIAYNAQMQVRAHVPCAPISLQAQCESEARDLTCLQQKEYRHGPQRRYNGQRILPPN